MPDRNVSDPGGYVSIPIISSSELAGTRLAVWAWAAWCMCREWAAALMSPLHGWVQHALGSTTPGAVSPKWLSDVNGYDQSEASVNPQHLLADHLGSLPSAPPLIPFDETLDIMDGQNGGLCLPHWREHLLRPDAAQDILGGHEDNERGQADDDPGPRLHLEEEAAVSTLVRPSVAALMLIFLALIPLIIISKIAAIGALAVKALSTPSDAAQGVLDSDLQLHIIEAMTVTAITAVMYCLLETAWRRYVKAERLTHERVMATHRNESSIIISQLKQRLQAQTDQSDLLEAASQQLQSLTGVCSGLQHQVQSLSEAQTSGSNMILNVQHNLSGLSSAIATGFQQQEGTTSNLESKFSTALESFLSTQSFLSALKSDLTAAVHSQCQARPTWAGELAAADERRAAKLIQSVSEAKESVESTLQITGTSADSITSLRRDCDQIQDSIAALVASADGLRSQLGSIDTRLSNSDGLALKVDGLVQFINVMGSQLSSEVEQLRVAHASQITLVKNAMDSM